MKFYENASISKTVKFLGMSMVGLGAAVAIGLPSSAQGNSDSSSGGYADPGTSPAGAVDSPSDSVNSTTNPNYGEPQNGSPTTGSSSDMMRDGSTGQEGSMDSMSDSDRKGPSAVGEGFPGPSEAPAGSPSSGTSIEDPTRSGASRQQDQPMGGSSSMETMDDSDRSGPSAVGEGFPGPSEDPAGSPSSGTSIEDPTRK